MTAAEIGGVTEAVEGAKLVELLSVVSTAEAFAAVIEGYSQETVEDAIALQDSQPKRQQLNQFRGEAVTWVGGKLGGNQECSDSPLAEPGVGDGVVVEGNLHPSLEEYQPGQEVWAFFPQSQDKWLKGIVEWVRGKTVRVKSGFLGAFVESREAIAPRSWELAT
jgi:hypothetical protein